VVYSGCEEFENLSESIEIYVSAVFVRFPLGFFSGVFSHSATVDFPDGDGCNGRSRFSLNLIFSSAVLRHHRFIQMHAGRS
jgi:hypothetical protein